MKLNNLYRWRLLSEHLKEDVKIGGGNLCRDWLSLSPLHWVKYSNNVRSESDLYNMSFRSASDSQKYGTFSDNI